VGAVSLIVTVVPAGERVVTLCTQKVSPDVARYEWITVWLGPAVRAIALSQSSPSPITQELALVVTREAVGAPGFAFPEPMAPMAPEPLVPVVLTPVKLITVMEALTLCDSVAVTIVALSLAEANVRQISAVPLWVLVLLTRTQVKPPPVTPLTETLVPLVEASAAMNARSNSLVEAVVKDGDTTVVALVERSVDVVTSAAIGADAVFVRLKLAGVATPVAVAVTV